MIQSPPRNLHTRTSTHSGVAALTTDAIPRPGAAPAEAQGACADETSHVRNPDAARELCAQANDEWQAK